MKNHYVSQLIIKRFSESVNTYDLNTKKVLEKRSAQNIFYKENFYTDEVEDKLASLIEDPFAKLLDKKVLNENETITLKRSELHLIKQYLLLDSIKTMGEAGFSKIIKRFTYNAQRYSSLSNDAKKLPSIMSLNLNDHELYNQAMTIYLECQTTLEMLSHPFITLEIYCWAIPFLDSFLTFWDSKDEEFILTDNGMTSEYETSHLMFQGLDNSKFSYLLYKLKESERNEDKLKFQEYARILLTWNVMYENYNIFNLSSTRCLILAHPFFRLYSSQKRKVRIGIEEFEVCMDKPDIWPSVIQDQLAFEVPVNKYVTKGYFSNDDVFIYRPYILSKLDTMYINTCLLSTAHELIGFGSLEKVINSIKLYMWMTVKNDFVKKGNKLKFNELLSNHKLNELIKYALNNNITPSVDTEDSFMKIVEKQLYDLNTNIYLYDYLLSDLKVLEEKQSHFSFIGNFQQIVNYLNVKRTEIINRRKS